MISKDIQMTELCSPEQLFWVCEALLQSNSQMLSVASCLKKKHGSYLQNKAFFKRYNVQQRFKYTLLAQHLVFLLSCKNCNYTGNCLNDAVIPPTCDLFLGELHHMERI